MKKITTPVLVVLAVAALALTLSRSDASERRLDRDFNPDVLSIPDYNYKLTDIAELGITSEQLFKGLDPDRIILGGNSICSNRALMWAWRMKHQHNVDSGKIFVFYTRGFTQSPEYLRDSGGATGTAEEKQWYYHVAPYVIENGQEIVLDHGFNAQSKKKFTAEGPIETGWDGNITRPITMKEWMLRFPKTTECKEITSQDKSITRQFINGSINPPGKPGEARCYYRKTPMQIWTPLTLAALDLKLDNKAQPLRWPFARDTFEEADVVPACEEAIAEDGPMSKVLGRGAKLEVCLSYLGLDRRMPSHMRYTPYLWKKYVTRKERALDRMSRRGL